MKRVSSCYMKQALAVAIMTTFTSLTVQATEPVGVDNDVLVQVMALYGLDEHGAIGRLAAEEEATDLYHRVRSMNLSGYAGAWFDADSGKLRVALNDAAQTKLLERLGVVPVSVGWSLDELKAVQTAIMKDTELVKGGLLRSVHVDYMQNRVVVGVAPGNVEAMRERLMHYAARIDVREGDELPELSTDVRGGDGTRNYTFEQNPEGSGYYPCSVGAAVENGFYTAGHCGRTGYDIRWAANYTELGLVGASTLPYYDVLGDIGWVSTFPGWTPVAKINGYSDGIINVPAKWAGTNEAPINTSVCRYGQTSSGPHCGTINAKGQHHYAGASIGWIANVTEVDGSCSSDGDSGGTWTAAIGNQIQGTTIGRTKNNYCPGDHPEDSPPSEEDPPPGAFFQPISDHINEYGGAAGSLLTTHGAAAPTIYNTFKCPDMSNSGAGTFICNYQYYNSQGVTNVNWTSGYITLSADDFAYGTCTAFDTVSVTLTITNPYGSFNQTKNFACPMGPIP